MKNKVRKIRIDWDVTDDEHPNRKTVPGLPKVVKVPADIPDEEVADWLSDKYGWCVNSWEEE